MTAEKNLEIIRDWLTEQLAELLEQAPADLDPDRPLEELNAISLDVVHVVAGAMRHFGIKVPRTEFDGNNTINKLAALLHRHQA